MDETSTFLFLSIPSPLVGVRMHLRRVGVRGHPPLAPPIKGGGFEVHEEGLTSLRNEFFRDLKQMRRKNKKSF
jgi:hypothetical protein